MTEDQYYPDLKFCDRCGADLNRKERKIGDEYNSRTGELEGEEFEVTIFCPKSKIRSNWITQRIGSANDHKVFVYVTSRRMKDD